MARSARALKATPPDDPGPDDRYINREQLRELIPTADITIARWQRDIGFPAPVKLGNDGRNYWWLPAIRAWTQRRAERQHNVSPADPK
jgi:predicted DNA-binding transcriptional regulator AlpA